MNSKPLNKTWSALAIAAFTFTAPVMAQNSVAIINPGFENPVLADGGFIQPIPGWDAFNNGSIGVLNPTTDDLENEAPEGDNIALITSSNQEDGLSQTLAETFQADVGYELSVQVGNTIATEGFPGYRVQLLAGGSLLAEDDDSETPPAGGVATSTVSYTYDEGDAALVGQPLEIRLLSKGLSINIEVAFDDVQLTVSLNAPVANPGGPYTVAMDGSLMLDGSASMPSDGATIVSWEWDLNNNDDFSDASGETPTAISREDLEAQFGMVIGNNPIQLRVTDSASLTSTASGTVNLASPIACQLRVLDLENANGGINPATDEPWAEGDTYRLVFVTNESLQAISTNIKSYNEFVQSAAKASTTYPQLGNGLWKVVGSTATVAARDNTATNPVSNGTGEAIFLIDGTTLIASDYADLWGGINNPIDLDQNGDERFSDRVLTGSSANGTQAFDGRVLGGSNEDPPRVMTGRTDATGGGWMVNFNQFNTAERPVFAMSEMLTVVDLSDTTAPTLVSIEDNWDGGPVGVPQTIVYTVTFDKPMSAGSVEIADFENASETFVTFNSVNPTEDPAVYEVVVSVLEPGTLQLQIKQGAELFDLPGNALDTTTALTDDTIITLGDDVTPPTLVSITDNVSGGPIVATRSRTPQYTVTFSEPIDSNTLGVDDFENAASAPVTINSVTATGNQAVFLVTVTTSGPGELRLQIKAGAVITDLAGNALDTSSPLPDDTTITVNPPPAVAGQLGVFDVVNANGGINPATGVAWAPGDSYRLAFVTSQMRDATAPDIATYNAFVQNVANAAGLRGATWNVIGSTASVNARDNTGTNPSVDGAGVPIILMDGRTHFASDNTDLWNSANVALRFDENGAMAGGDDTIPFSNVFAGTFLDGTAEPIRYLGTTIPDPTEVLVQTGNPNRTGATWIRVWSAPANQMGRFYALSVPLFLMASEAPAMITSITRVGDDIWELTLLGDPDTDYEFRPSTTLEFNPGILVETLTPGDPAVGTIGGNDNSILTTDSNGEGTVRMILTGPRNFVAARKTPAAPDPEEN